MLFTQKTMFYLRKSYVFEGSELQKCPQNDPKGDLDPRGVFRCGARVPVDQFAVALVVGFTALLKPAEIVQLYRLDISSPPLVRLGTVGKVVVAIDPKYFRPTEVDLLIGDPTKSKEKLGWVPEHNLASLVKDMMQSDIKLMQKKLYLKDGGY